mmetsp:Transcript_98619/g.278875  ORF Transcript_98619/g.278875 Transcript_98619/m.278875 type:complete len:250 (-) Transcript_98619:171-920(-)
MGVEVVRPAAIEDVLIVVRVVRVVLRVSENGAKQRFRALCRPVPQEARVHLDPAVAPAARHVCLDAVQVLEGRLEPHGVDVRQQDGAVVLQKDERAEELRYPVRSVAHIHVHADGPQRLQKRHAEDDLPDAVALRHVLRLGVDRQDESHAQEAQTLQTAEIALRLPVRERRRGVDLQRYENNRLRHGGRRPPIFRPTFGQVEAQLLLHGSPLGCLVPEEAFDQVVLEHLGSGSEASEVTVGLIQLLPRL